MPVFIELKTSKDVASTIALFNATNEYIIIDLETTGLNPHTDKILDIVICGDNSDYVYTFKPEHIAELHDLELPFVAHNFRFDLNFLNRYEVNLKLLHDTMLLDHLLEENVSHSLEDIVQRRYKDDYKTAFWAKYKNYSDASPDDALTYSCKDVWYTSRAYRDILSDLASAGIPDSLLEHTRRLALTLYNTELAGIKLDLPYLEAIGHTLSTRITALKVQMRQAVDLECTILENNAYEEILDAYKTERGRANAKPLEPFNWDSSAQLPKLLYGQLSLPVQVNNKRRPTCDDDALAKIERLHPVLPLLREYRGHKKIYGSFIEGSLEKMYKGRIYPSFNVNGTVTGRISSSSPNMQQLPTEGGVRGIYIPDEGYRFISCDYSQLEVVIAAHYSKDKSLFKIIFEGASQHDITANGLGIPRSTAKTVNFALQYGAGARKLQQILSCSPKEAEEALQKYWETYSGLRDFVKECHTKVDKSEDLVNIMGRRRRLRIPEGAGHWEIEALKRQAPSSLIQGGGGDLTSMSLYLVDAKLRKEGIGKAMFSIHDEVLIQVKEESCEEGAFLLKSIMETTGQAYLSVPLKAEVTKPTIRWEKG